MHTTYSQIPETEVISESKVYCYRVSYKEDFEPGLEYDTRALQNRWNLAYICFLDKQKCRILN